MRILLVEDDRTISHFLVKGLREELHVVDLVEDGIQAEERAYAEDYDLIVLDVMLPGLNGVDVCRRLRAHAVDTPILMLTAREDTQDRVSGLDAGADDYLTKPFALEELTARIRALIRRASRHPEPIVTIGELRIDLARRRVYRDADEVELTGREYGILELLIRHRGAVVARANLHEHLYDDENELMSNAIDVHIASLRRKLGPTVIQTRRGLGYLIDA